MLHANAPAKISRQPSPVPHGYARKIVLATNVAESLIAIPDVTCVVDCGRVKEVRHHRHGSRSCFLPVLRSKRPGVLGLRLGSALSGWPCATGCLCPVIRKTTEQRLPDHQEPELQGTFRRVDTIHKSPATMLRSKDSEFFASAAE